MVACGLAMGVFVGLVVVRGTGEAEGSVTATVNPAATSAGDDGTPGAEKPVPAGSEPPAAGDSKPAEPAATPPPAEPPPPPEASGARAVLTFNVTPPSAVVTVDARKVADGKPEVKLLEGKARVRLVARADGFKRYDKSHLVTDDEAISIELVKKPRRSSSSKGGGSSGPGGLIDLR
jgi:hypothetical protein